MLVYGKNVALEILRKENSVIKKIIIQEGFSDKEILSLIEFRKIRPNFCSKKEIDNLSQGLNQGIILDIPDYKYLDFNSFLEKDNNEIVVILDHIEDPHNFGAIIRTCEAAGIKNIIIPKDRQVLVNGTVMKTSAGTLNDVDIIMVSNLVNTINEMKNNGYWIVGTALDNSQDYRTINYDGKIALIIGNEGSGISQLVAKNCDFLAKIPMYGNTNSLNASVAAGIMIYEVIRNRK